MSYCVNCGVELSASEKHCPLCHVEVINPKEPWEEPIERPYSHHFDTLVKRVDRRYFATLAALLLLIPVLITFMYDLFSGKGITWSAYVIGAIALLFVLFILPMILKRTRAAVLLAIDSAAVSLYLLLIERMSNGSWFLAIALPITVFAGLLLIAIVLVLFGKKVVPVLLKSAFILMAGGVLVVWVELVISLSRYDAVFSGWSFYVLIPCAVLSSAAMILEHRKNFKEQVRRRLFY